MIEPLGHTMVADAVILSTGGILTTTAVDVPDLHPKEFVPCTEYKVEAVGASDTVVCVELTPWVQL
jgi:hypothetical protein